MKYADDDEVICKFQRPIAGNMGNNAILVYNEDRSFEAIEEMDEEDMAVVFPNEEYKTYWACVPNDEGYLTPVKQLEEQDW